MSAVFIKGLDPQPSGEFRRRDFMRRGRRFLLLRAFERVFALMLLAAFTPLLLCVTVVIAALSRRSPLVAHVRVGSGGLPLRMLKLRTMWETSTPLPHERRIVQEVKCEETGVKLQGDPRVTSRFAAWCRIHSIDELPQLWHVVRGEMSLVGPRPLTRSEIAAHYGENAEELLSLLPGMTGLWQVTGRNRLTYRQRRRLDLYLVRNYCWGLYWKLIWRTLPRVVTGAGAW